MFLPSKSVKSLNHQDTLCSDEFTVLCWNVAKLSLSSSYKNYLKELIKNENIDILLLQEVKKQLKDELDIFGYSYLLSPNIQTKRYLYGVLSAFKISCEDELSILTKKRELSYATHKVSLITRHKFADKKELLIVNLHAINFVANGDFYNELESIKAAISSHKDAIIVAGDFNTWNRKRVNMLREFADFLSLKEVTFADTKNQKKVFSNCLDYIFYRGLELVNSKIINSRKISDHNPIIANFKLSI